MKEFSQTLCVRDWQERYEINRNRALKRMTWLALPTDQGSDDFIELLSHENGLAHFGVFVAILQLAANCNPRGELTRSNGEPHTATTIARIVRAPDGLVADAIERLLAIGLLTTQGCGEDARIPHGGAAGMPKSRINVRQACREGASEAAPIPHEGAEIPPYKQTDKQTEQTQHGGAAEEFIKSYPRKTGIQLGLQTYRSVVEADEHAALLEGLERWKKSEAWTKNGGQFIPEPGRWLTDRRWEEHPAPAQVSGGIETPLFKEAF